MTTPLAKLICRILPVAAAIGVLAACAPPPSAPSSSNLTLDMRRMQSSLDQQEQAVQSLSRQVAELESRLQRQAEDIEQLRQSAPKTHGRIPTRPEDASTRVRHSAIAGRKLTDGNLPAGLR